MGFSKNLELLRNFYNLSQEQLAKKIKLSNNIVEEWENDLNQPNLNQLKKISKTLKVPLKFITEPLTLEILERRKYFREYNILSFFMAFAYALIPFYFIIKHSFSENENYQMIGEIITIFVSIFLFLLGGIRFIRYLSKFSTKTILISDIEKKLFLKKIKLFGIIFITTSIVSVYIYIVIDAIKNNNLTAPNLLFILGWLSVLYFFVMFIAIQHVKYKMIYNMFHLTIHFSYFFVSTIVLLIYFITNNYKLFYCVFPLMLIYSIVESFYKNRAKSVNIDKHSEVKENKFYY